MKQLILLPFLSIGLLQANNQSSSVEKNLAFTVSLSTTDTRSQPKVPAANEERDSERMSAAVFKSQQYCRAELKDFEFDAKFIIVSATVYFSGANFSTLQKGTITSSSLKPISSFMVRCTPGSIVTFDDVKVLGPDKKIRTIPGISMVLY